MKEKFKKFKTKLEYLYFETSIFFLLFLVILISVYHEIKSRFKKGKNVKK